MSTKIYIHREFSTEPISEYASEKKLYEINQRKMRILAIKVSDKYLFQALLISLDGEISSEIDVIISSLNKSSR